jgi:hypothetical protein
MAINEATVPSMDPRIDEHAEAVGAVYVGLWTSAVRCLLTYVVAPALGAVGVALGPVGLVLQLLGAITSTAGARRLWALRHRGRYVYAAVAVAIWTASLLTVLALV